VCVCVLGGSTTSVVLGTQAGDSTDRCPQWIRSAVEAQLRHPGHRPGHARPHTGRTKVTKAINTVSLSMSD